MTDIITEMGLTPQEQTIMNLLVDAFREYDTLPIQHPSDKKEFAQAIHVLQGLLSLRITRRDYQGWHCDKPTPSSI